MICCSCGKEIDINYGREYWNGIYCKKCADEMLSTPEYIKNYKRIIADLQAENAALRERLEEAEIPCHIGDTLYEPFANTMIREWTVDSIYIGILGIDVNCQRKDDYKWHDSFAVRKYYNDFGKRVFLTREAAEARLAELKGGAK